MNYLRTFLLTTFCICATVCWGQQTYVVDGATYTLQTEVDGSLKLLWNIIDEEYRYFVKKGDQIQELKNTRVNRTYQEEYKKTLQALTTDHPVEVERVAFTLPSLEQFFNSYNAKANSNFIAVDKSVQLSVRLGAFAGITNTTFFVNPENTILPTAGLELEITDTERLRRHGIVMRFKQTFASSSYDFSASDISLNYRFKFVRSNSIDIFINTKIASYVYLKRDVTDNSQDPPRSYKGSGGDIRVPGAFGLGADIALGNGFITIAYNDIVALGLDTNGEFPVDLTLGYKLSF
ncbi:MAG: hypothetical protein HKM28_00975 [Flavobacteriaceae bacterium]|nr:hypothetical protein [Flavobacteriaceae bacterium]